MDGSENMLDRYGVDLKTHSPHMLRFMLVDMTPACVEDDIVTRPETKTYEQILKYCRDQADYRRVKWSASGRIKDNRSRGKLNSLVGDDVPPPPSRHPESRPDRSLDDEA